ncbi:MAG: alpha/beta hydrolase [Alphaproteobacteria bacterium]|nr:alpha/beta hydrolase [Alphaproteobacteria bacterium]
MTIEGRTESAANIALRAHMTKQEFVASPYVLTGWTKLTSPHTSVNVYIEGDGLAWLSKSEPSGNPTPKNPVALTLAAQDPSPNVVYLARPCQYTPFDRLGNHCQTLDWTSHRFSSATVDSYQQVLDQIKEEVGSNGFNLIGYSGGGNIAGLLASRRQDILSLRTVAGNVDNNAFTKFHGVSSMPESLNMADVVEQIATIPQIHFVGEKDPIIPKSLAEGLKQKAPLQNCIQIQVVKDNTHMDGWEENWSRLLNIPFVCSP